jgi:hypothetical protein
MLVSPLVHSQALENQDPAATMQELRREIDQRAKELSTLKQQLDAQEARFQALSRALDAKTLESKRGGAGQGTEPAPPVDNAQATPPGGGNGGGGTEGGGNVNAGSGGTGGNTTAGGGGSASGNANGNANPIGVNAAGPAAGAVAGAAASQAAPGSPAPAQQQAQQPVGQAPVRDTRPPEIAPLFEQPGVLTPAGKVVVEPSVQYGYSSSNRVSLIGYTIIPALLIGLIDVREVKTTTLTGTMAVRYGVNSRFELELRVPYAYSSTDTVERQIFQGAAEDNVFNASGHNIGDVEMTARYQFNDGGADRPYYIGWLRFKSRTGTDPFSVVTDCVARCAANTTGTGLPLQTPTGSGFYAIQPGITWLLPSDPAVFFGNFSYLHNFTRSDVSLTLLNGAQQFVGDVHAGDIFGFNFGMGLALNEKASFSIGYDQSIIWPTSQNGQTVVGSVRTTLGTLLVGYSYAITKKTTLNISVGAGLTRDTPDLAVTFRLPIMF